MAWSFAVRSLEATHFRDQLATNAIEHENIVLPGCLRGMNGNARSHVRAITLWSDENLDWEIMLFSSDSNQDTDPDVDNMIGWWQFTAAGAVQIAGSGLFRHYIDGLAVPYVDDDNTGELHIALLNRHASTKTAGDVGSVVVEVTMEPMTATGPVG